MHRTQNGAVSSTLYLNRLAVDYLDGTRHTQYVSLTVA